MKIKPTYLIIALAVAAAAYYLWNRWQIGQRDSNGDTNDYGGGGSGDTDTGSGGSGGTGAPASVRFLDSGAMRWIGNDGRSMSSSTTPSKSGARLVSDTLYDSTGFIVPEGYDVSAFQPGLPVRIESDGGQSQAHTRSADVRALHTSRDAGNIQRLLGGSVQQPHYETGIYEIQAIIPAIPGHGTNTRGHWVVTNSTWRGGSTGKEPGRLTVL